MTYQIAWSDEASTAAETFLTTDRAGLAAVIYAVDEDARRIEIIHLGLSVS